MYLPFGLVKPNVRSCPTGGSGAEAGMQRVEHLCHLLCPRPASTRNLHRPPSKPQSQARAQFPAGLTPRRARQSLTLSLHVCGAAGRAIVYLWYLYHHTTL
jgi:hypothetical protein